jgi:hypothetical protein
MPQGLLPASIAVDGEHYAIITVEPDRRMVFVVAHTWDQLSVVVCVPFGQSDVLTVGRQLARATARIRRARELAACVGRPE